MQLCVRKTGYITLDVGHGTKYAEVWLLNTSALGTGGSGGRPWFGVGDTE